MTKRKLIYILISLAVIAAIFIPGFSRLQELKEENSNLERRIEVLTKTSEELKKEKDRLLNDPTYIEKIAREKLGMSRKDEIILK